MLISIINIPVISRIDLFFDRLIIDGYVDIRILVLTNISCIG